MVESVPADFADPNAVLVDRTRADRRQLQISPFLQKQLRAKLLLKLMDLPTDGGLRNMQLLCGLGDVLFFCHLYKIIQLSKLHCDSSSLRSVPKYNSAPSPGIFLHRMHSSAR